MNKMDRNATPIPAPGTALILEIGFADSTRDMPESNSDAKPFQCDAPNTLVHDCSLLIH